MDQDNSKCGHEIARDKVEAALRELIAYESEGEEFLVDWLVLCSAHVEKPGENRGITGYRTLLREGQPPHNTLGLLENEVIRFKNHMLRTDLEGRGE